MDLQITLPPYYPVYPEDDMPEIQAQRDLAAHLIRLFENVYANEPCFITGNVQIVAHRNMACGNIVPDVMVFLGLELTPQERFELQNWNMNEPNRPAPTVVFEIVSEATWRNDLAVKPEHYRRIGVPEYFGFDPLAFWRLETRRLRGWRYPIGTNEPIEIEADEQGRLWSEAVQSFLVADERRLRVYDRNMNERLTGRESDEYARRQADAERQKIETERQKAQERAERLAQKLRELNIDPDEV